MKSKFINIVTFLLLALLYSCTEERIINDENNTAKEKTDMSFTVVPPTGTTAKEFFKEGDVISVFSSGNESYNEKFTITEISESSATFTGKAIKSDKIYAVFPYSEEYKMINSSIDIPFVNTHDLNSSESKSYASIGFADKNGNIQLEMPYGNISFTMPSNLYGQQFNKIRLSGAKNEALAGTMSISIEEDKPSVKISEEKSKHTLVINGTFEAGQTYSFKVPSLKLENGAIMTFHDGKGYSFQHIDNSLTEIKSNETVATSEISIKELTQDYYIDGNTYHILTLNGLLEWRDLINSGNNELNATLENDIDFSGITEWEPIGNGTVYNGNIYTGVAFKGIFNGNNHKFLNLCFKYNNNINNGVWGIFGITDNAKINSLIIGEKNNNNSITFFTTGSEIQNLGVIAGYIIDSHISNCTNNLNINYDGTSNKQIAIGCIGYAYSNNEKNIIENIINNGTININTNNELDRTKVHIGGIVGITNYNSQIEETKNIISYCENHNNINSTAGRTGGIVAYANNTEINSCLNNGNIIIPNSINNEKTLMVLAGIVAEAYNNSTLGDCINNGNIKYEYNNIYGRCGGLVGCVAKSPSIISINGCTNTGEIINDSPYRGVFYSYYGSGIHATNCTAGGKVGTYNNGNYIYDQYSESQINNYLGTNSEDATLENITFQMGELPDENGGTPNLRILFIGNSFTMDAVEHLPKIISGANINDIKLGFLYYGGSRIEQHLSWYDNSLDYTYYYKPCDKYIWSQIKGYTPQDKVKSDNWDIITIQEHTGNRHAYSYAEYEGEKERITDFIGKIKTDCPNAKIYYIMSQAYTEKERSSHVKVDFPENTTELHYAAIVEQGKKIENDFVTNGKEIEGILPTGTVLQNLRYNTSITHWYGWTRDGYHMDYGLARYAASCLLFESLITPKYQINMDNNTFRISNSNDAYGSYTTPVNDSNKPIAIQVARDAMNNKFDVTKH